MSGEPVRARTWWRALTRWSAAIDGLMAQGAPERAVPSTTDFKWCEGALSENAAGRSQNSTPCALSCRSDRSDRPVQADFGYIGSGDENVKGEWGTGAKAVFEKFGD